jgi:ABC-2 type transport system ATP-binding protein
VKEVLLKLSHVRKRFGRFVALQGVSLDVHRGEIFGLLGPNGAGKTTLMNILACLDDASEGEATLAGMKLSTRQRAVRHKIGIGTQDLAIYEDLSARENLRFFGKLYGLEDPELEKRANEILKRVGLLERADTRTGHFSGGMKRRLNLGVAIIHQPEILFLDEPTTGVDPQSRNHIFEHVRELNRQGMTIIYTSHYMEEVQNLCPRIAILDHGRIIACDTREGLLNQLESCVTITVDKDASVLAAHLGPIEAITTMKAKHHELQVFCRKLAPTVVGVITQAQALGMTVLDIHTDEPNLEKVFLHLTDNALRD